MHLFFIHFFRDYLKIMLHVFFYRYFKFCRPQNSYGTFGHSNYYSAPHGPSFVKEAPFSGGPSWNTPYQNDNAFAASEGASYGSQYAGAASTGSQYPAGNFAGPSSGGSVSFKDADAAQSLAYASYAKK